MNNGSVLITGGRSPIALSIAERLSLHTTVILLTRDITTFPSSDYDNNANILIRQLDLLQDSCRSNFNSLMIEFNITMLCFAHRLSPRGLTPQEKYVGEVIRTHELITELIKNRVQEEKRVVVLTSPASKSVVEDQDFFYHANKSSLSALIRYFAVKYASKNFAINAVSPGSFVSKERSKQYYKENPRLLESITNTIPSRNFTSPVDIATYVEFLLAVAPMTLNGTELVIDSGLTLIEQSTFARNIDFIPDIN